MRSVLCTVLVALVCSAAWAQSEAPTIEEKVKQAQEQLSLTDEAADLLKTALTVHDENLAAAQVAFDETIAKLLDAETAAKLKEAMNTRGRGGRQGGQRPQGERPQGETPQGERPEGERPPSRRRAPPRAEGERPQRGQGGPQGFQDMTPEEREAAMRERQLQRFTTALETAGVEANEELSAAYTALLDARQNTARELEADLGAVLSEEQIGQLRRLQRQWTRGNRGGNRQRQPRAPEDEVC